MREIQRFLKLLMRLMSMFYVVTPTDDRRQGLVSGDSTADSPAVTTASNTTPTRPLATGTIPKSSRSQLMTTTTTASTITTTTLTTTTTSTTTPIVSSATSALAPPAITRQDAHPFIDSRVSWIYDLSKEDLKKEMAKFGIDTNGKTQELRKRFSTFWKASSGFLRPSSLGTLAAAYDQDSDSNAALKVRFNESEEELASIREILGLSPNADGESVRRTLTDLVRIHPTGGGTPTLNQGVGFPSFGPSYSTYENRLPESRLTFQEPVGLSPPRPTLSRQYPLSQPHSWLGQPHLPRHESVRDRSTGNQDLATLCNTVRKWNLRFDGRRDPVSFLERLEELTETYNLASDEILKVMPEILTGTALLWYRNSKEIFFNYYEFRQHFEMQFLPPGYRRNLDEEIRKRTQGQNEPFRNYVVAITTLIRRQGNLSGQERLDLIFSNMRPDYKLMVRRQDCVSLAQLMERAEEYEAYLRDRETFRPPPPPTMALVPEVAYQHKKTFVRALDSSAVGKDLPLSNSLTTCPLSDGKHAVGSGYTKKGEFPTPQRRSNNTSPARRQYFPQVRGVGASPIHPQGSGEGARSPHICWNCHREGHSYRNCDQPKYIRCFYCKADGVMTTRCPCRQGNSNWARGRGHPSPRPVNASRPPMSGGNGSHP